jgi:hypothetical protein
LCSQFFGQPILHQERIRHDERPPALKTQKQCCDLSERSPTNFENGRNPDLSSHQFFLNLFIKELISAGELW